MQKLLIFDGLTAQCRKNGVSPTSVVKACGIDGTAVTRWRNGGGCDYSNAVKIADYFGCTVDDLINAPEKEKSPVISDEARSLAEAIMNLNPEQQSYVRGIVDALRLQK